MTGRRQYGVTTGDLEPTDRRAFMLDSPGSARDNDDWIRRQGRVVERFGHSSLFVGQLCRDLGTTIDEKFALPLSSLAVPCLLGRVTRWGARPSPAAYGMPSGIARHSSTRVLTVTNRVPLMTMCPTAHVSCPDRWSSQKG